METGPLVNTIAVSAWHQQQVKQLGLEEDEEEEKEEEEEFI